MTNSKIKIANVRKIFTKERFKCSQEILMNALIFDTEQHAKREKILRDKQDILEIEVFAMTLYGSEFSEELKEIRYRKLNILLQNWTNFH